MLGEILAVISLLSGFGIYQIGVNKETDRRLDNLRIDLNELKHELHKHIQISVVNQDVLEIRINANTAMMNSQFGIIDEKLNILTETINIRLPKVI